MFEETFVLNNGVKIPKLALGTWLMDDRTAERAVSDALRLGYRHIDTAQAYENERGVGRGVRGASVARKEIFVTSKVAAECKSYASAAASIDESLAKLDLGYIDLMLIHSPQPWMEVNQSDNRYFEENREVYAALEDAYRAGKVRAIGVSNFLVEDLESLAVTAKVPPMVNQILAHISNTPTDLIAYCQAAGIVVEAYSPVAHGEALRNPEIVQMAEKYGVSVARLCIKYDLQLGMVVLPKTANPAHMQANADLDFTISDEDMTRLKNIERIKDYGASSFFPVFGGKL
ncbi:MAG: aldo/keto reductase [Clostridia bacterium]|nr:aldo/keto reductase [Clostridia bacterium]